MAPLSISDIPTLTDLYTNGPLAPSSEPLPNASSAFNSQISLVRTDITTLATTAIVNAANTSLLGGGGVDGAIHRAAGPGLLRECRTLHGCDTGSAKMTGAYNLPCEKVIHAVGPVYHSDRKERCRRLLAGCYTASLDLLVEGAGGGSIAFSALSTGVYGYPSRDAAQVAIGAVKEWLEADEERARKVERVVFCSFLEKDERAYEEWIPQFFPPATTVEGEEGDGGKVAEGVDEAEEAQDGEDKLPVLPDVPTTGPSEPGQPDAKKVKLDGESAKKL